MVSKTDIFPSIAKRQSLRQSAGGTEQEEVLIKSQLMTLRDHINKGITVAVTLQTEYDTEKLALATTCDDSSVTFSVETDDDGQLLENPEIIKISFKDPFQNTLIDSPTEEENEPHMIISIQIVTDKVETPPPISSKVEPVKVTVEGLARSISKEKPDKKSTYTLREIRESLISSLQEISKIPQTSSRQEEKLGEKADQIIDSVSVADLGDESLLVNSAKKDIFISDSLLPLVYDPLQVTPQSDIIFKESRKNLLQM